MIHEAPGVAEALHAARPVLQEPGRYRELLPAAIAEVERGALDHCSPSILLGPHIVSGVCARVREHVRIDRVKQVPGVEVVLGELCNIGNEVVHCAEVTVLVRVSAGRSTNICAEEFRHFARSPDEDPVCAARQIIRIHDVSQNDRGIACPSVNL